MPITVEERFGWTFSLDSGEALYTVRGTDDGLIARVAVEGTAPLSMGGVPPFFAGSYAAMLALIVVVCIAAITALGSNTNSTFSFVGSSLQPPANGS